MAKIVLIAAAFFMCASIAIGQHKFTVVKTADEWKKILTAEAYKVTRLEGTEAAYSGKYWDNHEKGIYKCACCGLDLFNSNTKFDSGTGWPSFWKPVNSSCVLEEEDNTYDMQRIKVTCSRCGAHLGHVFNDGPDPTGLRYCMNSVSLDFEKKK